MKKGKLLIISGFSGVGKGTVVKYILDNYSDYKISISATTRSPREGEVDGTHYHFLTTEKFEDMIKNNQLLEYANYVGNYYGTPRDFVEKNINEGNNVILEIETQGALQVKKMMPEAVMIFVLPPNADTLKERLVGRQTETMEVINKRLSKAAEETGVIDKYDYFVINDEIADCAACINDIVTDNNPELIGSDCVNKIKNVLSAKEVMIIVNGHNKARALYHAVEGSINQMWTISALQMHEKGIIVADDAATFELKVGTYRYFKDIEADHLDPASLLK